MESGVLLIKEKMNHFLLTSSSTACDSNSFCKQLQAKLYLSIIDDVIESMRELFLDEGLEDRVLDDLRHVSYILHNPAPLCKKVHIMHNLTQAVSYSRVRSSSEEVYTIPGKTDCCVF